MWNFIFRGVLFCFSKVKAILNKMQLEKNKIIIMKSKKMTTNKANTKFQIRELTK